MTLLKKKTLSIIIPVYNEEQNIAFVYAACLRLFDHELKGYQPQFIFVNDGSEDNSAREIGNIASQNSAVSFLDFSRNFGKEAALSAGLHHANGDGVMLIDADMQHDPSLIPQFVAKWEQGAEVVIGMRTNTTRSTPIRWVGSKLYNGIIRRISQEHIPGATDFRFLDRQVVKAFRSLSESDRVTRGLIDWLGFRKEFIWFESAERRHGTANYSFSKLVQLALSGFIAHSLFPLKVAGYLGVITMILSLPLGIYTFWDHFIMGRNNFSGSFMSAVFTTFLMSINLISLGLIALYIGSIKNDTRARPLYVLRKKTIVQEKEKDHLQEIAA